MRVIRRTRSARSLATAVAIALVAALMAMGGPAPDAGAATTPRLTLGDAAVVEGNPLTKTGAKLSLHLSEPAQSDLLVNYTTVSGSATGVVKKEPGDFKMKTGVAKIRAGKVVAAISPAVLGDTDVEGDEQFTVIITGTSGPEVDTVDDTGVVTILDDDPAGGATLRLGDATVDEGDIGKFAAKVPLSLSEPLGVDLLVNYTLVSGSAPGAAKPPPGDFKLKTGVAKIRAGKTIGTISATIFPDLDIEGDEDLTVSITGTSAPGVSIGDGTGLVTIRDDDGIAEGTVPGTPTNLRAAISTENASDFIITWDTPDDGGSPILNWNIQFSYITDTQTIITGGPVPFVDAPPLTFNCAPPAIRCEFIVNAENVVGEGLYSEVLNFGTVTWATTGQHIVGEPGGGATLICPPYQEEFGVSPIWGTGIYTDDSSICFAAVHDGRISFELGGTVLVRIAPGQASYAASTQNGVESFSWPSWGRSFVFEDSAE